MSTSFLELHIFDVYSYVVLATSNNLSWFI